MLTPMIDRRTFLAGAAATTLLAPQLSASAQGRKTQRVVLVAFAGGVRTRETFGSPGNVPNLLGLAKEGVLYKRVKSSNLGHYGASLSLFTGVAEPRGIRENGRGEEPTVFEYVRKSLGLPASDVWIATSGGAQQTNYSYSVNSDYGARFGANTVDGDGLFNAEFKSIVNSLGRPKALDEREAALLARMKAAVGGPDARKALNSPESAAQVERFILEELTGGTADLRGPNAADAKAIRVARNLLVLFKPRLVAIVLQNADIAHTSFNGYVDVVRQNDAALGDLMRAIRADATLRDSTAVIVCPEFGRDRDLNSRRGLDHGDGSEDLEYVTAVAWGPDFARDRVIEEDVQAVDLCPTVCDLLGAGAPRVKASRLPRLFA